MEDGKLRIDQKLIVPKSSQRVILIIFVLSCSLNVQFGRLLIYFSQFVHSGHFDGSQRWNDPCDRSRCGTRNRKLALNSLWVVSEFHHRAHPLIYVFSLCLSLSPGTNAEP